MDGWMHAAVDLIAFGRPYLDLHQKKDEPSRKLGWAHRTVHHEWYWEHGRRWEWPDPFPAPLVSEIRDIRNTIGAREAERQMSWISHDVMDRAWDELGPAERDYWKGFFTWLILNPQHLKEWAGVDVLNGWIRRADNRSGSREYWEGCTAITDEYARLRRYVEAVTASTAK